MAEGRMAKVMPQSNRFGKIFIQAQSPRHGSGNLADLQSMSQSGSVMITFRREKNLRLIFQPTESFTMQDTVSINLKNSPYRARIFRPLSAF
jgi:hypothetical protein